MFRKTIILALLAVASTQFAHAGYVASATSNAAVRELQNGSYVDIQQWTFSVSDGNSLYSNGLYNTAAASSNGPNVSVNGMTSNSSAEADLATGKLKAYAHVANTNVTPANPFTVVAAGVATFSDSFRVSGANNGPFSWVSGSQVIFRFHLDGSTGYTGTLGLPLFLAYFNVFDYGTVGSSAYDPATDLGGVSWFSDSAGRIRSGGSSNMTWTTSGSLTTGGLDLEARFNPMGDFDWSVNLQASAFMNSGVGSQTADFGHTLTMAYVGPDGSSTTSSSGVFPGTISTVPEPSGIVLVLFGLAGLALSRQRLTSRNCI